jgi:2-polyprenyl-3-methyl-5-hydroxy-6-metoxy-1,4-benzoquinol methylase
MKAFEVYGKLAKSIDNEVLSSGRYLNQESYIPTIIEDIINKLNLKNDDILLDIGCGTGIITSKLLNYVSKIYAIDHESIIKKFMKLHPHESSQISFISANFLDVEIDELYSKFDKILAYSVLHYLKTKSEVIKFVDKTLLLLKPRGTALFGDIPNISRKNRFLNTEFGKQFSIRFSKNVSGSEESKIQKNISSKAGKTFSEFTDDFLLYLMKKYREDGYDFYILPQDGEKNAFGYTREDILIKKYEI